MLIKMSSGVWNREEPIFVLFCFLLYYHNAALFHQAFIQQHFFPHWFLLADWFKDARMYMNTSSAEVSLVCLIQSSLQLRHSLPRNIWLCSFNSQWGSFSRISISDSSWSKDCEKQKEEKILRFAHLPKCDTIKIFPYRPWKRNKSMPFCKFWQIFMGNYYMIWWPYLVDIEGITMYVSFCNNL